MSQHLCDKVFVSDVSKEPWWRIDCASRTEKLRKTWNIFSSIHKISKSDLGRFWWSFAAGGNYLQVCG